MSDNGHSQTLTEKLIERGFHENPAKLIGDAFGNEPEFFEGLETIAQALANREIPADCPTGEPWRQIYEEIVLAHNDTSIKGEFLGNSEITATSIGYQRAVVRYDNSLQITISDLVDIRVLAIRDQQDETERQQQQVRLPKFLAANELLKMQLTPPTWAIPDYLPVGLTILGGRPKLGKSWLALQIAQAVGAGGMALGRRVERGKVLYLALEDSPQRIQNRMRQQGWPDDPTICVYFVCLGDFLKLFGPFHKGGADKLKGFIKAAGYSLVIIDTLSRAFVGIKDIDKNQEVTAALGPIQEIGQETNCAILVLDHHNKSANGNDPNPINDILGSTAKAAVLDTAWGLYKDPARGKGKARLMITGRDIEEQTLALKFDGQLGCWQNEGDADAIKLSDKFSKIIEVVEELQPATCSEIAVALDVDRSNLLKDLKALVALGEIDLDPSTKKYFI